MKKIDYFGISLIIMLLLFGYKTLGIIVLDSYVISCIVDYFIKNGRK